VIVVEQLSDGFLERRRSDTKDRAVKVREAIKLIEDDGWYLDRTRGSHRQFKHPTKPGLVTIAGKPGDDLAPGTKNSILKQAGLK
jgi:predicted RNA binding protein YcfA (HicA-like mRNA interferase family)